MKNETETLIVVLVQSLTGLGKVARFFTGSSYTHISVCLNDQLEEYLTFSRRKHYAPFDAGFMHETLDCYAFGSHRRVNLKLFKLPVAPKNWERILAYIDLMEKDPEYLFNLYAMVTMPLFKGFRIYKAHNCMSFVGKLIELSGVVEMERPYYRYDIPAIDRLLRDYFWKEASFEKQKIEKPSYMEPVGWRENSLLFLKLNGALLSRMLTKRNENDE